MQDNLDEYYYFSTPIFREENLDFLEDLNNLCDEKLSECQDDEICNHILLGPDPRLDVFCTHLNQTGWDLLVLQGYDLDNFETYTGDLWLHEHKKNSYVDTHSHGFGAQISGFYVLNCDDDSPKMVIHDPRPTKVHSQPPEKDCCDLTYASTKVNFTLSKGHLFFMNSWLQHSFNMNFSDTSLRFIHFNLYLQPKS